IRRRRVLRRQWRWPRSAAAKALTEKVLKGPEKMAGMRRRCATKLRAKRGFLVRPASGLATLRGIEQTEGTVKGTFSTILKIQKALEHAGIHFTEDGTGVRALRSRSAHCRPWRGRKSGGADGPSRRRA